MAGNMPCVHQPCATSQNMPALSYSLSKMHVNIIVRPFQSRQTHTNRRVAAAAAATDISFPGAPLPSLSSTISPSEREIREEEALRASKETIYGIPRAEWLKLNTPARYLGNEFGSVHKPWSDAEVRFCLSYPEVYEVGASNLGHIILYGLLNKVDGVLCDRSYFPAEDMKALLERYQKRLFGVESRRPLHDYHCLGFSLSYELGGTNILDMLHMSGIPLTWNERKEPAGRPFDPDNGSPPLIFAGGPTATSNPEPFAEFFDFFALGDGEELLPEIAQCLKKCRAERLDRDSTLFRLATEVEGVYVPQFYDAPEGFGGAVFPNRQGVPGRVRRRVCDPDPFQQIGLVPYVDTVHNRLTVEIRRGCTRGCRFCQPGMLTRPARDVAPEKVVEAVEWGMRTTGYNEFSLLSLSCSDYLSLPAVGIEIKNRLGGANVALSLPSQRVDAFTDDIANIISNGGRRSGLTFAPEAGTQRMRDVINKGLTNEELLRGVKTAWDKGWRQVKLYFMIGLPGETDADVLGIAETIEWLQRECRQGKWHLAVNVTISNFSPKPHTPFQWHSVSTEEFLRKQSMLKEALSRLHQVKANFTPVSISAMEDFMARGDRRVAAVVHRAWELGATNDGWWQSTSENHALWSRAIEESGMTWKYRQVDVGEWDVMDKIGDARYRKQGGGGKGRLDRGELADARLDAPLPWDHVDTGIAKWWLKADLQRALEAATVPDCSHSGVCSECGVCGEEFGDNVVYEPPPVPEFEGHGRPDATRAQRLRFRFSKNADMVFVGHLDLMTLWDRACRRAALPISADESPFSVRTRIYAALPLPLGATASAEMLEINLTERRDPGEVLKALQTQLPPGLELLSVEEAEVKKADGRNGEKMSDLLRSVEYYVAIEPAATAAMDDENPQLTLEPPSSDASTAREGVIDMVKLQAGVAHLLASSEVLVEQRVKSKGRPGRGGGSKSSKPRKTKLVDIRPALMELQLLSTPTPQDARTNNDAVVGQTRKKKGSRGSAGLPDLPVAAGTPVVRFRASCANGNPQLSPALLVQALGHAVGTSLQLSHLHRSDLAMSAPAAPPPNWDRLKSLTRMEGHLAAEARFRGTGRWSGGLDKRVEIPV